MGEEVSVILGGDTRVVQEGGEHCGANARREDLLVAGWELGFTVH